MKSKKAFTLVELLGVIVVLAILALITIPIISNVINDVRIKSLENSAYGLVEASNLYYISKGNSTTIRFDKNKEIDTLKELSYKGTINQGTVIIDKKGNVTVCITDGKNSAYKNYNEKKVTTSKGKICSIKENSSIVYLDNDATITEYSLSELTELVDELKGKVNTLESSDSSQNSQISNLSARIGETNNAMISLNDVYPIGSIYITVTEDTVAKVQAKFGGTWVAFGSGRTLVGVNTSDSEFDTIEETGGEKTHTLTESEMPEHDHSGNYWNGTPFGLDYGNPTGVTGRGFQWSNSTSVGNWISTGKTGGNGAHNNLQPYITVYMYKRTA